MKHDLRRWPNACDNVLNQTDIVISEAVLAFFWVVGTRLGTSTPQRALLNERITLLAHKFFPLRAFLVTFVENSAVQILLVVDLSVPGEVLLRAGVTH